MIINVQFQNKKTGSYGGREYSYRCDLDNVRIGDILIAPTVKGEDEVRVSATNVPESTILPHIRPLLKTISKRKEGEVRE